ncbi:hypothetical protein Ddc_24875 [Ditylenchus destructor]|nr:hypothetical protein Ddc_24875 [Ditylenchus destructor]
MGRPVNPAMVEISHRLFTLIEAQLAPRPFLVAERPTLADLSFYGYTAQAPIGGVSLADYPRLRPGSPHRSPARLRPAPRQALRYRHGHDARVRRLRRPRQDLAPRRADPASAHGPASAWRRSAHRSSATTCPTSTASCSASCRRCCWARWTRAASPGPRCWPAGPRVRRHADARTMTIAAAFDGQDPALAALRARGGGAGRAAGAGAAHPAPQPDERPIGFAVRESMEIGVVQSLGQFPKSTPGPRSAGVGRHAAGHCAAARRRAGRAGHRAAGRGGHGVHRQRLGAGAPGMGAQRVSTCRIAAARPASCGTDAA